jgi:uncharacterized protein
METAHESLKAGQLAFQDGFYAKAVSELLPLARKGNVPAQYQIARMYHEGKGLPEDNATAFRWAHKAADQGSHDAAALLGVLYAQGQGVAKDDDLAATWFHHAAHWGNPIGQTKMGMCYLRGIGVPKDATQAYMWFDLAAAQTTGHDLTCNCHLRDTLAAMHLTPAQIADAQRLAREWKPEKPTLLQRLHLAQPTAS